MKQNFGFWIWTGKLNQANGVIQEVKKMQKKKKSVLVLVMVKVFIIAGFFMPGLAGAGLLDPPEEAVDDNGNPVSTMVTLEDIYGLIDERCAPSIEGGVQKTGQTTSYAAGDDGDLEKGVAGPIPRFTDNGDGTVTDNLTGLIWLKNANCFGFRSWSQALADSNTLNSGECGLTDGTVAGDWRLSNIRELQSLIDFGNYNPALPSGHPFTGVQLSYYWSSTTSAVYTDGAWSVYLGYGSVYDYSKTAPGYVWPVRGGQ
jgi:hypothetical protein